MTPSRPGCSTNRTPYPGESQCSCTSRRVRTLAPTSLVPLRHCCSRLLLDPEMGLLAAPEERQSCSAMLLEPHSWTPPRSPPLRYQPRSWLRRAFPVPLAGPTTAKPASHSVPLLDTTCASYPPKRLQH